MLAILIALRAYEEENGEPFEVDQEIFQDIIAKNIKEDLTPLVSVDSTEGNRIAIHVEMTKDEENQ